jgi:hypothetical protein
MSASLGSSLSPAEKVLHAVFGRAVDSRMAERSTSSNKHFGYVRFLTKWLIFEISGIRPTVSGPAGTAAHENVA